MSKYKALLSVLDAIRQEALQTKHEKRYNPPDDNVDLLNNSRSRAYVHLYLKVRFGLREFLDRETYLTDDGYDGGIDGYFIDNDSKIVYIIQSKFRTTEKNYESKEITAEELVVMDIDRIVSGEDTDINGNQYNGKIKGFIRKLRETEDIARYSYKVVVLANLSKLSHSHVKKITGGYDVEVFDYERCYKEILFPLISGTDFIPRNVHITIDLSNKGAASRIKYDVQIDHQYAQVNVVFIPTYEIAVIMDRYRNGVLKHNPRSYLELSTGTSNVDIMESITHKNSNEFALLNNGITIISDETFFTDRTGRRERAHLEVVNPQIINGGQTAYTLARIFQEKSGDRSVFEGKEVLVKIITLQDPGESNVVSEHKRALIEKISTATNKQTAVTNADRLSSHPQQYEIQKVLFDRYGIFYERKTGAFADALRSNYISRSDFIDRYEFSRIARATYFALFGKFTNKNALKQLHNSEILTDHKALDRFYVGFRYARTLKKTSARTESFRLFQPRIYIASQVLDDPTDVNDPDVLEKLAKFVELEWKKFVRDETEKDSQYVKITLTGDIGKEVREMQLLKWIRSPGFRANLTGLYGAESKKVVFRP